MRFLPSCCHVGTTVWMHHLDFNETLGEKASWELNNAACSFYQIMETAPNKTVAVQPLASHLTNNMSKMTKIFWAGQEK